MLIGGFGVIARFELIERQVELWVDGFSFLLVIFLCVVKKDQILIEQLVQILAEC